MSNYHTRIQEVIQWQNIRQLVHFTRIANLRSIIEYGILSRQEIEKRKIKVEFNDPQRLDAWPNTSSVSITEKNIYLFPKFVERSKTNENDWFDILINPSIIIHKINANNIRFITTSKLFPCKINSCVFIIITTKIIIGHTPINEISH